MYKNEGWMLIKMGKNGELLNIFKGYYGWLIRL